MAERKVGIEEAIERLTALVKSDPEAMLALITHRVPCSEALCQALPEPLRGHKEIGMLGVLNAIFAPLGYGLIRADGFRHVLYGCARQGTKRETAALEADTIWAVHVLPRRLGDESLIVERYIAATTQEEAHGWAARVNRPPPGTLTMAPLDFARAVRWPGTSEEHAADLARGDDRWAPAEAARWTIEGGGRA